MRELDLSKNVGQQKPDYSLIRTPDEVSRGAKHVFTNDELNRQASQTAAEEIRPDGMSASNLVPIAPPQDVAAAQEGTPAYDYFQLKLKGVDDRAIWNNSTQITNYNKTQGKPSMDVIMPNREEAWEGYGKEVFKGDRTVFDSQFDNTTKRLVEFTDNVKKDLYFAYNDSDLVKDPRPGFSTVQGRAIADPEASNKYPDLAPKRTGYIYDQYGALQATKSRSQVADDNEFVIKEGKKISADQFYKERSSESSIDPNNYDHLVLANDDDGSITGEAGKVYWKAVDASQSIKGSEIRSVWGPSSLYNNWAQDLGGSAINSFAFNLFSIVGSLEEVIGTGLKSIGAESFGKSLQESGNRMQNVSSALYFSPSEMQNMGVEDTHMREVGGLVGMVAQAALGGAVIKGGFMLVGKAAGIGAQATKLTAMELAALESGEMASLQAAGLSATEASAVLAKSALKGKNALSTYALNTYAAQRSATMMKTGFALMMTDGMYQGAKEAGLGEKERALVFGASFATNMFLMGQGAKWFAPNTGQVWRNVLGSGEAMEVAKRTFAPIIKESFEKVAINLGKPVENLVAAEAKVVNNTAIQRVMGNLAKKKPIAYTIDATKALGKIMKNSANPMLSHMTTAPIEFAMINTANNFITGAHDYLAEDNLNEQGRLNTPGEGLFKEKESRFDLADGLGHSLLTGLVMGAYGGIGESYAYRKNPQLRHQERTITDFLFAGKGEELKTAFDKMHKEEWYGSSHLDANGEVIRAGQVDPVTGEKVQSLNDIGFNSAKASFDALEEVYNTSGIKQWHLGVKDSKGVNQRYLKDTFDKEFAAVLETVIDPAQVAKDAVELVVDKNKLKSDLETATTDKDKLNIQKEIETIDNQLNPFLESVAKQNSSGKKVISNVESRAIRNGMVRSRYASGKDPITKLPTFGVDLNIIKGVKSEFGEFQSIDDVNADVVDLLNKRANDLIDPAVIGKIRDENNTEVLSIVEDIKGGINSDILGRVQTLHSKHLTSGVRPSEKLALDNMISELQNAHDANSETIISELSAKYGVEINEGNAGNFQQVYNEALAKDPAAATTHGATIEALSNTDGTINRVSAEISAAYKKGEMSDADVLKYVYTSNNAGFSLDEIIKNIEKTDFTNPADIHMLNDVLKQIVDKVEILDINKQVYNKLDDQISLLNSKIAPTDKDVDHTLDGSIKKELFDLFDRAFRLKDKATTISSQARELFDAAFVSRDTNIRIVSIENISSIITFVNARDFNSDKDINDTIDLIDVDKIKIENLKNENSIVYNKITVLEELRQNKTITDDQINELNELHKQNSSLKYDIFSHVVSAEHKIHQIFNSKNGEKFYKEVVRNINEFFLQGKEENIGNFGLGYNSHPPEITPSEPNQSLDRKSIKDNLNRSWYYSPELLTASSQSANIYQRSYAYQNAINSVTNIKRHSPKTFYENYKAWEDHYIKNDPNFIAPSFEQQRSIYQSVAFLLDPKIEGIKSKTFIENSLSVLGFAGVGKTKVMVPAIIDLYLKENQNRGIKTREIVVFTAPHAKQRENLKSSIEKINIKEDENKPLVDLKTILDDKEPKLRDLLTDRILVIDEASELSKEDVLKLTELQKKYGFKILNLIDESQITGQKGELFAPVLDSQKTTPVTDVHRTGIYDIVRLQQIFREPLFDPTTSKFFVNYSPTEFTEAEGSDYAVKGVRLRGNEFTSITEQSNSFVTDLKKDIADGVAGKTVFVVATDADRETLVNELSKSGINKDTLESSIKTLYGKETTAKGLQFDRVYVNLKESSITNESEYYKALLTAASRGISFVDIITTKSSASIVSAKKGSLFSDNAEYKTAVEASYKEYAAKQPELINQILKNATSSSIKSTIPSVERPPADPGSSAPPDSGAAKAGQTAEKDSAGNPVSTKLITPTEKLESTYDAKVPETTENITKSYTDKDGNQVYLKEELEGTVTGVRAVKLTDGVNETLISRADFENNYNESQEPIEIESIDTSTQSSYKGEDTVVKEFHPKDKDKNATTRVSSLHVDLFPEAQQQVYNKAKDHLLKTQLLNPKNPLNGYLKKVFINQFESGTGGNKKVFKKGIYNVVDVEGLSENYMSIFGTQTPELINNKYFIFGLETNVDGFKGDVDKLSIAIEKASEVEDPAKYYDDLVGQYKDLREHQINRDRFVDRANAYKLASLNSTKDNNKVTELSNIIIDKFTNGNTVFGSKDTTLAELFKPKQSLKETPTTNKKADIEKAEKLKMEWGNIIAPKSREVSEMLKSVFDFLNDNFNWGLTDFRFSKSKNALIFSIGDKTFSVEAQIGKMANSPYIANSLNEIVNAKYDAELAALGTDTKADIEKRIQEVISNNKFIKLSDDETHYINTKTGKKYKRVSDIISTEKPDKNNKLVQSSLTIGKKVDSLIRDFFAGELKELITYNLSDEITIKHLLTELQIIKDSFKEKGETVLANDIVVYNDELGIAGTVDLLTYDKDGNVHIYDMKTIRGNNFIEFYKGDTLNKYESTRYGKSKKQKHTEQLSLYRVLLNNTHGILAKTIGIIPVEVKYNAGDNTTSKLNLLKRVNISPLNKVENAELASASPVATPTPTAKVNGMYPVEMQGKTVYFSDPHLIHNPDKITNTTIVKYKKGNEEVFEPGYYIYYTLDPNGQTRGMIKVKSSVVTKDNAISLFKNYFINAKDKGSFLSNAFYDDMNRFISTNRQFFDKLTNNNPKNKKEAFYTVTSKENKGVSYQNYKVQAFKTNDEIDFNKTKARIAKIIDALEKNHDALDIKMHSFPAINPKNSEILTFNSKENLTVNLENINWPQIVTHEGNVRSSINTKSNAETNPFLQDSGKLDFSIDTSIPSPDPNAPKGADLLITDGNSSSEPVTQGKPENIVTKEELTRDEKAKNGLPALNTILGSNKNAKVIIDNISRQVINRSNLSRNFDPSTAKGTLAKGTLSVPDAINSAFEFYKSHYDDLKNAEFEITSEGNTVIKTIDELTYNDVLDSGKEDVRNAYFVAQIVKESEGFRPIFDTAIKQIFPKTILYTDAEAKAVQSETQFDHEDLSKNSSITTKLNQERTSPAKGYSDQMKMVLNSIVYSEYYRDSNGELKTTPTKTGFTPDDTISLFATIKGRVGSLISPLSNNFNVFKKEIENALRNSTNLKPGEKSNSNSFNKLASLYYSFFHDGKSERFSSTEFSYENPLGGYSYLDWVKNQDAIHKEMFNGLSIDNPIELPNGQFSDKVIIQKGKEASLVLSEFQSVVTSNVKKEYIHSVYNDKDGQVYKSKSRSTTVSQFVYNIKQALKGSIYHEVEGIRNINRGVELALNDAFYVSLVRDGVPQTELFTKAEIDNLRLEAINNPKLVISNVSDQSSTYGFRIEQDGVYVVDSDAKRTKIVNRNLQKNLVVYSFESNDNGQIFRNVKSLFKQFGINDIVSSTTINSYLNESINHIEHNNTFDTQIKNNVNKATLAEVYYNLIEEIGKKEIPGSKIAEEFNQAGSDIEKGILDWGFIQDLATVESINLSKSNIYWKLNPSGDKVYTIQHSSALTDVFNSNNVNRSISDNFYENLSLSKGPSPMIDEKGFLYNPLFNNSEISLVPNEYNILDLNISNGAERFKSGKSVSQMSRKERYRDEIDANFINQLIKASPSRNWSGPKRKGYTEYGITVPGLTSAADIFYLNINATDQRSSPVLIREGNTNTKDNKPRAKANWDYFSYSFLREFQKQRNYQEISTEQLTNAIKEFDFGKFLNIKNAKTNSAISNRIVDTFNIERAKLLRNPDSIQRFFDDVININPEVAKVFFDYLEQSKSVDNNTHYKYVKGKVVVGNSVNYKFTNSKNGNVIDDVFTLNNFNKINDYLESKGYTMKSILDSSHKIHESKILDEEINKNVKGFMRQLVTQRMKNFINDLHKNNVYANEKTRNFFETEQDLEASGNVNKRGLVRDIRSFDQKEWDAMTQEDRDHFENTYYRTKGGYWNRDTSAWVPSYKDAKHIFTEINPFYEGYLLAYLNHSNHINDFVMGDSRAYDNLSQISHRTYTATTPGIHYTIRDNGIGFKNTAKYIIYNDSKQNVRNPIARLLGNAIKDSTSSVDGLEWQTGIDGIIQQYSLGLNVVKNPFGHKKEIYNNINLLTGKKVSLKSSTMNLKGYRKNSKEFREIERKMLSIEKFEDNGKMVTLYDKLVEFEMNDEAVVDWMFQVNDGVNKARQVVNDKGQLIDIRDAYASRLMPPSVAKIHSGAAVVDLDKEFTGADTFEANMNSRLYVLDLNKESRDSESTYSAQMGTTLMMGKGNEKATKSTLHNLTEFNDSNTKKLSKVGADGIKKLLREKIGSMPNIGNTVEIVGDIRFGNHLSILNKSIRSFLGLEFSNGIKPKMKSSGSYVQYPGEFVTMYEIGADVLSYNKGQAFTLSQYEKALVKLKASGIDSPEALFGERVGENKGLKSTKAYVVEGGKEVDIESFEYLSKIYTPEQLALAFENGVMRDVSRLTPEQQDFIRLTPKQKNDIVKQIITTGGKITPYEIIMPFQQYVEFGFNNNPKDPFYYKNFDVDDILLFKSKDGREINYNDLGATPEERKLALGELIQTHSISNETIAFNRLLNNKNFEEKENDGIKEIDINEVHEKMSEYYENFISITEQFLNRTPASTSASGFRGKVIAFDNDISNTVLVSSKKNVIDNSDYDIDEVHTVTKTIPGLGQKAFAEDSQEAALNKIISNNLESYKNPDNLIPNSTPVGTDVLEAIIGKIQGTKAKNLVKDFLNDVTTNSKQGRSAMDGEELPGIFANAIKTYIHIYHSVSKIKGDHFAPIELFGKTYSRFFERNRSQGTDTGYDIVNNLASLLQAAVDNNKLGYLGELNTNTTTANAIIAMSMMNVPGETIFNFIKESNFKVSSVIKDVMQYRNIDQSNKKDFHFVTKSWTGVIAKAKAEISELNDSLKNPLDTKKKEEITNAILEKIDNLALTMRIWSRYIPKRATKVVVGAESIDKAVGQEELDKLENQEMIDYDPLDGDINEAVTEFSKNKTIEYNFNKTLNWLDSYSSDVSALEKVMIIGDKLSKVAKVLGINQGIKSSDWQVYDYLRNLEELKSPSEASKYADTRAQDAVVNQFTINSVAKMGVVRIPSEKELIDEANAVFGNFLDFNKFLDTLPHIKSYINSLYKYDEILSKNILSSNNVFKIQEQIFLSKSRQTRIKYEDAYDEMVLARNKVISSMYLETRGKSLENTGLNYDYNTKTISSTSDISTPEGQVKYKYNLHELIRDMKANPSKFEKRPGTLVDGNGNNLNLFLENLQIYSKENGDEYLTIPSLGNASDNIKVGIQESLKQLKIYTGIDMESLMFNYHLIEDGVSDKKGSSASLISKDYLINYDSFLSELHSNINQQAGSIALRYEDRLAVHMLEHLPSNSRTENIKGDFELNYKYSDKSTDKTYEGGIIPKYRTENNPEYRPIGEFAEYIRGNTPISGERITYEAKLNPGVHKLEKIEDPEIVPEASVDNPVYRYVRVTNRVSEMLSSWGVNSTVKEVYGKSDQGRTLHIIPLKKLKDLNNGRTVTINPADMSSDYDVLSKYKNGKYIVKTGQVVDVKRFRVGGKTGLKITLDNLTSSENPLDASMVNDFEGASNYPGVDFKTREQVLKSVDPAAIPNYNTAITNDYFTIGNNHSLVSSISSKSLNHPMAILADAFLKSNMSARLKSTAVIFKSAIANPEAFKGFSQEDVGRVAAYYDQENNIIVFNSDISNSAGGIERVGLHEVTHVYSSDVLNRYLAGKPLKNNERVFAKYIVDLHAYVSKNINKALADKTIDDINSISGTVEYAISNPKEFLAEIFTKKSFQDVMMKMNAMNPEVAKLGVKNIWQEFVSVMKDLFFGKAIPKELNSVFDEVMAVSSRYMEGESMFEVSQLNKYDSSQGYNMYLPESMAKDASKANGSKDPTPQELRDNYYGFGVKVDKITNNNDLITAMVRTDIKKEGNDPNNVTAVSNLYNAIIKEMSTKFTVFGKFTYMANGKVYELSNITDKDAVTNLAKQIIKERSSYEVTLKDSLVNFLKGNVYTSFSKDVESNLPWLKGKFAVNPATDVVNLLSNSKFKSDFFDKETFDPIIIHSNSDISGKTHISIMDMTTRQLTTKLTPSGSAEYLADFITKYNPDAIKQGSFRLLKTEAGMRKFNLMLSAMLIHSKNPNIVIDKMSIIKPTGKSNSESYDVMYWDHLPEMKAILTDPIIKDILPKELKDLINNPKAFDIPEVNYLTSLASFYYDVKERYFNEALDSGKPVDTRAFEFEEMGTNLQKNDNLIGHNIFRPDVIRMLSKRINAIREYSKDKEADIVANEEMRYLSKAIELITYKGPKDEKMEDISDLVKFLGLNYNISNPAYDMYRTSVMSAIETGKNKYITYKTGFDNIMDKIRKLPFGFTDVGYKYFKRLYIHTDATDRQGNVRNINSYSIHHSGNLKSLEAVKKSELSKDELELGDYIVKTIKEGLIEKQINKGLSLENATNWYEANWQDGMIPIMAKRVSEKIFTKDAIAGLKQWLTKYSTSNEFFDYIDKGATSPYEVSDQFLFQAGNSPFGSAERMNKIGLYMDNATGKITINGVTPEEIQKSLKTNQDEVEQNLEVVMAYFTMNHHQKTELDKTQSMYLASQTILHNYEAKASDNPLDGRLTNLRAYMRDMNDFIVMGKRKRINSAIKIGNVKIQVDDIINVVGSTTAAAVLYFNVFADFKNISLNTLMFQALAFSHTAAGAKGLYGEKDAIKAIGTISTNPMLAKALSWQYKMAGMDRSNLLNNPRHLPTTKAVLDTRHGYFGQFIGDYGIRTASLLAYMNNKGVLDAHRLNKDGDLIYDETKDARMYKDGKITENGKLIKMELLKNMKEQGIFFGKVDLDSKLPQAFDNDLRDSIKTISDKFITGGAYDDATALNLEAHSIGKMFAVFKRYLPDKLQNLYLKGHENPAIFDYVVKDVEIGGETKSTVVKEHMYMEGMVQSVAGLWSEARKISASGDYKTISEMWKNQKDIRRINLIRVTHDIIFANIMLSLLPILFGDDEMTEEERRHTNEVMSSPIGKAFNYSIQDMINPYKPNDYFNAIAEPFFALTALKKQLEIFPALLGTTEGALDKWAEKNLGAYKSIEAISGNLSGTKSDKAKKKKYKKEIQKNN